MKQILISIILFSLTTAVQAQNRFFESDVPRFRSQIFIPLSQNNQLYVAFNHWAELDAYGNVDSLLQLYKQDLATFEKSVQVEYHKLLYVVDKTGSRSLTPFSNTHQLRSFRIVADSSMQLYNGCDTLIIERRINSTNELRLPSNIRIYFLVDRFDQLGGVENLNQQIQQARKLASQHPKKNLLTSRYRSTVEVNSTSRYPATGRAYNSMPRKIIRLGMGTGVAQNELYTTFSGEFTVLPELKQLGFRVGWDEYFHFQKGLADLTDITRSSFVNVGLVVFQRWPLIRDRSLRAPPEQGGLTLGYLVRGNNGFFPVNTWRLTSRISLARRVKLEPELYWNGFFKQVYPGIRLNVNFFTNE